MLKNIGFTSRVQDCEIRLQVITNETLICVLFKLPGQYPHLKAQFVLAHCAFLPTHCSTL